MASSSKKRKKPVSNPARGFATTSTASKPKPEKACKDLESPPHLSRKVSSNELNTDRTSLDRFGPAQAVAVPQRGAKERDLHELSPEELEARLEEAELQNLVDKYAASVKKDASRCLTKLQIDCRLLRRQAEHISVASAFPAELLKRIAGRAKSDLNQGVFFVAQADAGEKARPRKRIKLTEEDATMKLWRLRLVLRSLNFREDSIVRVLEWLLSVRHNVADAVGVVAVWGLEESLDWLAVNLDENELPIVDENTGAAQDKASTSNNDNTDDILALSVAGESRPGNNTSKKNPTVTNVAQSVTPPASDKEDEDVSVSDIESDLEPENLIPVYIKVKTRLYKIRPDLLDEKSMKSKKRKDMNNHVEQKATRSVLKLQQQLKKIESDTLLDEYEAERQWILVRNRIAKENAMTRRSQLTIRSIPKSAAPSTGDVTPVTSESRQSAEHSEPLSGDDDALRDLFASVIDPKEVIRDPPTDAIKDNDQVLIRNFSEVRGGAMPWRVLEDTCRSRDAGCKVVFKSISSSAFSNKHLVHIVWSQEQAFQFPVSYDSITSEYTTRMCKFSMKSIATPNSNQSKALVSTFALFQVFSNSSKDEKVYLRLPSAWREFWFELIDLRKVQLDAADRETISSLRETVRSHVRLEEEDEDVVHLGNFRNRGLEQTSRSNSHPSTPESAQLQSLNEAQLKDVWSFKINTPAYAKMLEVRQKLPMFQFREASLRAVSHNQVTIICGETGCGKSTQMPSFILENELSQGRACKIYCTEPRRISAITLAQRVSEELGEAKSDLGTSRSLIGYAIRLESHVSNTTRLIYATTGIVLRMLEASNGLEDVTHIVIDEVHERSIETDFLLIILRSLLAKRPYLKLILMSATVDAGRFSAYFDGAPVLNVPGRTFSVETKFLEDAIELTGHVVEKPEIGNSNEDDSEDGNSVTSTKTLEGYSDKTVRTLAQYNEYNIDYDLISQLITYVSSNTQYQKYSKAVLVFLPGIGEIRRMQELLHGNQNFRIHVLHSAIASDEQQEAFKPAPRGMCKIVLSTNIAETGVTIPDITCVIDTGKHKEMRYDERRQISRLIESFVSRANAKQRRGRAGRVQEGLCFHLFTKNRYDTSMSDQQTPEMLRLSLQDLCMRVKVCKLGDIQRTLADALDPPFGKNIRRAIDTLIEVGALTSKEELTALGQQLAKFPLDPYLGKLVLHGAIYGCLDACLTLAAMLTSKSPFVATTGSGSNRVQQARFSFSTSADPSSTSQSGGKSVPESDLLTDYNAYQAWRRVCTTKNEMEINFCRRNYLSNQTLANVEDLKAQLLTIAAEGGLVHLSPAERSTLNRIQNSGSRQRRFVEVAATYIQYNTNTSLIQAVIAWSLYPKLLSRDGKGWRNTAINQSITLHPTSILRQIPLSVAASIQYLSFYSIIKSAGRNYNASSLTPASPLALVLGVGEVKWEPWARVANVDGARIRFALDDGWKEYVAVKYLRRRWEECVEKMWKTGNAAGLHAWMGLVMDIIASWK